MSSGQSLYVVGQVLGHARVATSQRYSHLGQASLLVAVDAGAAATGIDWANPAAGPFLRYGQATSIRVVWGDGGRGF